MAQTNVKQFNAGLDRFLRRAGDKALVAHKKVAFMVLGAHLSLPGGGIAAHVGLLQLTPVDTGRAVGNWQVSIGSPSTGEVGGSFGPSGGEGNRAAAESRVQMAGARALAGLRPGQTIWICNNLPYIVVLNDGGVNRTAHHMLERAIENTLRALR